MTNRALGLIEVKGYLGAVVAADAALKAANVSLLNIETVKSGLNTVQLIGDVSAVRSAVDAAVDLVQDEPYYLASHVISRLDQQTDLLFVPKRNSKAAAAAVKAAADTAPSEQNENQPKFPEEGPAESAEEFEGETRKYAREELETLKVVELRSLAYRQKEIGLSKKEIKFANKKVLIQALMEVLGKE
ncbi:BMC domain-containing protein [Streptococcus panodentis]|uniref:Ethanolamine utilization protein n=1 Tax=Streptococcus panodentis TaxID=1581472 RepID=A0ABS5AXL8_9STRE|nr:BMC domain-containing protein [Streptococcus panodentis]MBP2621327.1 ethanolamine utilization protein [Streptococcus panodentis]